MSLFSGLMMKTARMVRGRLCLPEVPGSIMPYFLEIERSESPMTVRTRGIARRVSSQGRACWPGVLRRRTRELDLNLVVAVGNHIPEPLLVRLDGVDGERGHQAVERLQLVVLEREAADLGRADGGEVGRVREEDRPLALFPLMEGLPLALRGVGLEVRHDVAQAEAAVRGALGVQAHVCHTGVWLKRVHTCRGEVVGEGAGWLLVEIWFERQPAQARVPDLMSERVSAMVYLRTRCTRAWLSMDATR